MVSAWAGGREGRQARKWTGLGAVAGALAVLSVASPAHAQFDGEFSIQRFDPAPGTGNYITTRGVHMDPSVPYTLGAAVHWGYEPFNVTVCTLPNPDQQTCASSAAEDVRTVPFIENIVTMDLMGSWLVLPKLQLGMRVPITYVRGLGLDDTGTDTRAGGLETVGLGDTLVEAKYAFVGVDEEDWPVALGATLFSTIPFGTLTANDAYIGDGTPSVGGRFIVERSDRLYAYAVNLGGVWRGQGEVGGSSFGAEMRYSVAGRLKVSPVLQIIGDAYGATRFSGDNGTNVFEVDAGARLIPWRTPVSIDLGAGAALARGVGAANARVFLQVVYRFDNGDRDGDGIPDNADRCVSLKEDRDGHDDGDGCPDFDDDKDGLAEDVDKCPAKAEDPDGVADGDGCPETDADGDGIADEEDRCPEAAETVNGDRDDDGCPEKGAVAPGKAKDEATPAKDAKGAAKDAKGAAKDAKGAAKDAKGAAKDAKGAAKDTDPPKETKKP